MSYSKLSEHFKSRTPFKYNKEVHFDGTKIVATEKSWEYKDGRWQVKRGTDEIVLAEHIEHNGKSYAVVYNRGNKCFATEVMMWGFNNKWRSTKLTNLLYGELGKPTKDQQRGYRCQMIDALIYGGAITHILIPTSLKGDSAFFKLLEG
tara:strand:+ start:983 stop:1429 length:447 start_codon:yes stop_codon:yes gene_type:complete